MNQFHQLIVGTDMFLTLWYLPRAQHMQTHSLTTELPITSTCPLELVTNTQNNQGPWFADRRPLIVYPEPAGVCEGNFGQERTHLRGGGGGHKALRIGAMRLCSFLFRLLGGRRVNLWWRIIRGYMKGYGRRHRGKGRGGMGRKLCRGRTNERMGGILAYICSVVIGLACIAETRGAPHDL